MHLLTRSDSENRLAMRFGFLLDAFNIRNLCYVYFFLAPLFLDRGEIAKAGNYFAIGYFLSGSVALLALFHWLMAGSERITFHRFSLVIIAFIALCFLSILINTPYKLTWPGAYYYKYLKLILPVICFFVMTQIWSLKDIPKLYSILVATAVVSVFCLIPDSQEYMPLQRRMFGFTFFDDPNKYALFLNILYGMTFPMMIQKYLKGRRLGPILAANVSLLCLLAVTQSRTGLFTCLVITLICVSASRSRKVVLRAVQFLVPCLVLVVALIIFRYTSDKFTVFMSDLGRIWTYMIAFNIISHNPIAGVGYANTDTFLDLYGSGFYWLLGKRLPIHNILLEVLAELGIPGLILLLLLLVGPIWLLARRVARHSRIELPVIDLAALNIPVAFFCYGLTYPNFLADDYFWIYLAFTVIVLRSKNTLGQGLYLIKPKLL